MDKEEREEQQLKEFDSILESMSNDQFWTWVRDWYDEQPICDTISNWDSDVKIQEIPKMKEIIKQVGN